MTHHKLRSLIVLMACLALTTSVIAQEPTAEPEVTATAGPTCPDAFEPNDTPETGAVLVSGDGLAGLTLHPQGDVDYFKLWGKADRLYQVTALSGEGLDTRLRVFTSAGDLLAENDDFRSGDSGSRVNFTAPTDDWLTVAVDSAAPVDWGCRTYGLALEGIAPPTATPLPASTPATPVPPTTIPAGLLPDAYEPNYDPVRATVMGVGQSLALNLNPWPAGEQAVDNDFFRLYVKIGQELVIETLELAPGLDTNLILYRADGVTVIGGNDDCAPGERRSCLDWRPDYTGEALLLVGPVGAAPAGARDYILSARDRAGETPTPQADGGSNSSESSLATPSPSPTALPAPTLTPTAVVRVRGLAAPAATPTAPVSQPVTVDVTVYYDENDNKALDLSEGVPGLSVRVLDGADNRQLGQIFTDEAGHARMTVAASGPVRLSIPYLAYNQTVKAPGEASAVRIKALRLPSIIP